ncbi:hypothetical protein SAMN05216345_103457 [Cupriavidus sp. YR651]|nr:hypothetical protein SAMN05216345_103457 [Cupriavidus sp. YR651]
MQVISTTQRVERARHAAISPRTRCLSMRQVTHRDPIAANYVANYVADCAAGCAVSHAIPIAAADAACQP